MGRIEHEVDGMGMGRVSQIALGIYDEEPPDPHSGLGGPVRFKGNGDASGGPHRQCSVDSADIDDGEEDMDELNAWLMGKPKKKAKAKTPWCTKGKCCLISLLVLSIPALMLTYNDDAGIIPISGIK